MASKVLGGVMVIYHCIIQSKKINKKLTFNPLPVKPVQVQLGETSSSSMMIK